MYHEHFGFHQDPFSIAPDPSFLFLSESHNEALAHLLYGFTHGGFVLISGEVGTGKTTLLRNLLDQTPDDVDVAFILNPRLTVKELLESLCDELGIPYDRDSVQSVKQYIDLLNRHLLKTHQAGRSTVVIIDEAQILTPAVLEQIRLLTNLETNNKKLLRIILLGQPELLDMVNRTDLRQLSQRITARYHLRPLSRTDTGRYVSHRLTRAGGNPGIFTAPAITLLYRLSKGTPRLINVICDRALLGAYVQGKYQVDAKTIRAAAKEVLGTNNTRSNYLPIAATALVTVMIAVFVWIWMAGDDSPSQVANTQKSTPQVSVSTTPSPSSSTQTSVAPARTPQSTTVAEVVIARPSDTGSLRTAFQTVFALWGANYDRESNLIPCDFAPKAGLQCLRRSGGWSELRRLNTPVVMELWDTSEEPYYGALTAFDDNGYELHLGDAVQRVEPRDLRNYWFGSYIMLWQTPPNYRGNLSLGDEHASVQWLHENLAMLTDADLGPPSTRFTPALESAVRRFQAEENLIADGVVGPLTWIKLGDRLNLPAPKLVP